MRGAVTMRIATFVGLSIVLAACASGDERTGGSGDGGPSGCIADPDCNDGLACTIDSCGVGGVCRFNPLDERCERGQVCDTVRGCVSDASCDDDADCDDTVMCTYDTCGVGGVCSHMPLDERCMDDEMCDSTMGCVAGPAGCSADTECDDMVMCTLDTCNVMAMCEHTPVNERCEAGETCTMTGCEAPPEMCTTDDDCQDTSFCNGRETCNMKFGCQPATEPRMCDDGEACTVDACDDAAGMCTFRCDASMASCMCPMPDVPCSGRFAITPAPMQRCAGPPFFGSTYQIDYNVMFVTFSCLGPLLSVSAGVPRADLDSPLTQSPRAMDATFDVSVTVEGGCNEIYRIQGTFTDPDNFTGTWTAMYVNGSDTFSCMLSACANQTIAITGTRVP